MTHGRPYALFCFLREESIHYKSSRTQKSRFSAHRQAISTQKVASYDNVSESTSLTQLIFLANGLPQATSLVDIVKLWSKNYSSHLVKKTNGVGFAGRTFSRSYRNTPLPQPVGATEEEEEEGKGGEGRGGQEGRGEKSPTYILMAWRSIFLQAYSAFGNLMIKSSITALETGFQRLEEYPCQRA